MGKERENEITSAVLSPLLSFFRRRGRGRPPSASTRPGWQFNWLKFSLEKPLEFWLEFWLEFPLDSTEEKGPF